VSAAHAERSTAAASDHQHDVQHDVDDDDDDMKKADPEDVRGRKLQQNIHYNSRQSRKLLAVLA
jgi:hypothetical protein